MFTTLITLVLLADPTREPPTDIILVEDAADGHHGECGIVERGAGCYTVWWSGSTFCSCFFRDPAPSPCRPGEGDCSACTDEACWDPESMIGRSLDAGTEVCSSDGERCSYVPETIDVTVQPVVLTTDDLPPPTPELGGYKEVCILFLHVETQEIRRSCMMVKLTGVTCTSSGSGCEAPPEPTAVWLDSGEIEVDYADRESLWLRIE